MWPFTTVPKVGLRCVIEVFPDHTHLLFGSEILQQIIAIVAVNVVIYEGHLESS